MINRRALGDRVRDARELVGLTQAALAELAQVTTETISRLERGAYEPSVSTLVAVADVLDQDLDYLCGRVANNGRRTGRQSAVDTRLSRSLGNLDTQAKKAVLRVVDLLG